MEEVVVTKSPAVSLRQHIPSTDFYNWSLHFGRWREINAAVAVIAMALIALT
ncbi:MAG TPA: hypothetical protein VID67_14800 [Rhizomicrobium sp.]|jgi:hypothetical protein